MNRSTLKSMTSALVGGACLLAATSGWGADFNLRADEFTKVVNLPGGGTTNIHMWGFSLDGGPLMSPGPALVVPTNDTVVNIILQNDLSTNISLVIPNQNGYARGGLTEHVTFTDPQGRTRARSFVKQTPAGGSVTYTWNNVTNGTYLYYSGTHSALQVQMGLYGMLRKDAPAASPEAYPGVPYGSEAIWVFGEIDFDVHAAVEAGTYETGIKSMIHSVPEIYLLNGEPLTVATVPGSSAAAPTLVRMLNACYDERIPVVNGYHLELIAEDGRPYPYVRLENAVNLSSLKTRDARLTRPVDTAASFYDRRLLSMQ